MKQGRGLKYGVIGVGSMGEHHAHITAELSGVRLVGVADFDEAKANRISAIYDIPAFKDYKDLLPQVDAVSLVTPTQTHLEIATECLNAGKHILIEKPLTQTSEEAKELINLAQSKNLVLAAGFIERFNPAYQELKKILKHERLIGLQVTRFSPLPDRITDTNVIFDMMIHDLDLLSDLLQKDEIEEINCEAKKVTSEMLDIANATIFYKSGLIAKIEANRVAENKIRKIVATTERTLIEADLLKKKVYLRDLQTHLPSVHHTKENNQLVDEIGDFIKAVKSSSQPKVTAEAGYQALKLAEEVEKACS